MSEIDELRAQVAALTEERDDWRERCQMLEARVAVLEAGLRHYGKHATGCPVSAFWDRGAPVSVDDERACICGLTALLSPVSEPAAGTSTCPTCGSAERAVRLCRYGCRDAPLGVGHWECHDPDSWHVAGTPGEEADE